jgi:hypothetical protein
MSWKTTSWYELRRYPHDRKTNEVTRDGLLLEIRMLRPVPSFTNRKHQTKETSGKKIGWEKEKM